MAKLISTKTELAVLRGLCSVKKEISAKLLSGTDETYFHNESSLDAYKKIRHLILRSGSAPLWRDLIEDPSVSEETRDYLKENRTRIKTLEEAASAVKILNKYRQLRGLFNVGEDILNKLQSRKVDASDLLERTSDAVTKLRLTKSLKDVAMHIGKNNNSYDVVKKLLYETSENTFIPTGFRDYDTRNGGFFYKSLVVIAGTTGGGKSALASQMAIFWAKLGVNVVLVPLEMSKEEQMGRFLANAARIDVRKILLQRLTDDEKELVEKKYRRYVKKTKIREGRYTVFKPEEDMSIEEILPITTTYGAKIVLIDYISLLKGVSGDDQWQKLGEVARYSKIFASNNNMIVVLLAQLSEDGLVRYSRTIAEHADYLWKFMSTRESRENEILNIEQGKGRNAELFPFSLRAQLNIMRLSDLSREEAESLQEARKKKKKGETKSREKYLDDIADAE